MMQPSPQQQAQQLVTVYNIRSAVNSGVHDGQLRSVMTTNPSFVPVDHYRHDQSKAIGTTLIVVGVIYAALAVGSLFVNTAVNLRFSEGIPCGVVCIVTGSFGIEAGQTKTVGKVVTFLVLSVLTSIYAFCQAIVSLVILIWSAHTEMAYGTGGVAVSVESVLTLVGLVAGISSIWGASLGCRAACCCICCIRCNGGRSSSPYSSQYEILTEDAAYSDILQHQEHPYRDHLMDHQLAYQAPANMLQQQTSHQPYVTMSHSSDVPMITV